jgi:hypothetical protein
MYVFVQGEYLEGGSRGDLFVKYWDGVHGWQWADLGRPAGTTEVAGPSAITYLDQAGRREIYVPTTSSNGHLIVDYLDGVHGWQWADLGRPAGTTEVAGPSSIAYADSTGREEIYAFVQGDNGHLFVDRAISGSGWQWFDQGLPSGATGVYNASAISYVNTSGKQSIYAFADKNGGDLVVNWFDGSRWQWADLGTH